MKKRLTLQGGPLSLWRKTAGRARALLAVLLLWMAAAQAMAEQINGVAVYDKTTGVLTFDSWDAHGEWPEAKANEELYLLWDPAVSGAKRWFENPDGELTDCFNWSLTTRQATRVVFKEEFKYYKTLPTCHRMFSGFDRLKEVEGLDNVNTFNETLTDMSEMFFGCEKIESIPFAGFFQTENIKNMSHMFYDCYALENLDLSTWRTYFVEDMSYMFANCEKLKNLDMSGLEMQCVKDASSMFANCTSLTGVELQMNSGDLVNMQSMFYNCTSLLEVDLRQLGVLHNVTNMKGLFESCYALRSVNLSNCNAERVTDMSKMFAFCYALESVDMTGFKTANVTDLSNMFYMCQKLDGLDLSSFNTSLVTNMDQMFFGCKSLTGLDVSKFNTSRVTTMNGMFNTCSALTELDVSSFNTAQVTNMSFMFASCSALRDIYAGDGFSTKSVWSSYGDYLFYNCQSLPGYDKSREDIAYAHWGNGGYFQKLVGRVGDRKIGARGDELTANRVTLSDGDDLEIYQQFTASELTYTRTMDDQQWQAVYLPFSVTADALPEGYMAAAINDFHEYQQQDGTCHVELEARQIAAGESIDALTPFILRRVQDGVEPLTLRVEGVELTTDLMRTSTCASVERLYTFLGTMQTITTPGNQDTYFMQDADLALVSQPTQLPAGRWCMTVSNRSGSTSARALPSHISVKVSGDATAISTGYRGTSTDTTAVYDLQGRRLHQEPQHGVYIKNGKKYVK